MSAVDSTLQLHPDREDAMRTLFTGARNVAQNEIAELLSDFRQKRALGYSITFLTFYFVLYIV